MDLYFSDFKKDILILPVDDENWVVQAKNFQKL